MTAFLLSRRALFVSLAAPKQSCPRLEVRNKWEERRNELFEREKIMHAARIYYQEICEHGQVTREMIQQLELLDHYAEQRPEVLKLVQTMREDGQDVSLFDSCWEA